jgi:hypothetical protein
MKPEQLYCPITNRPCLKKGCNIYYEKGDCCALINVCELFEDFKKTLLFQRDGLPDINMDDDDVSGEKTVKRLRLMTEQLMMHI